MYGSRTKEIVWEIPNFGVKPEDVFVVRLKKIEYVQPCVLDLCSLSGNGESKLVIDDSNPAGLRPSLGRLRDRVIKKYKGLLSKYSLFSHLSADSPEISKLKKDVRDSLFPELRKAGPFRATITKEGGKDIISFDCKRVMRLSKKRAMALLMAFASFFSRPGFDAPLYEVPDEPEPANDCLES